MNLCTGPPSTGQTEDVETGGLECKGEGRQKGAVRLRLAMSDRHLTGHQLHGHQAALETARSAPSEGLG